jgi:hypothetical protein
MKVSVDVESSELIELDEFPGVKAAMRSIHCEKSRKWRNAALSRLDRSMPKRNRGLGDQIAISEQSEVEATAGAIIKIENADEFSDLSDDALLSKARDPSFRPFFAALRRLADDAGRDDAEAREERLGNSGRP